MKLSTIGRIAESSWLSTSFNLDGIKSNLDYSYSEYCNLIGQLQGTIFRSALVQGTIFVMPAGYRGAAAYFFCAIQLIIVDYTRTT